ncbi:MAG: ABC transporter substrate-binding protein [Candidatus Wallbacteria bacterium]|nr:ABC transporter substrate-binding protein [Candidatus Wallbacteria bacterium]
MKAYYLQRALLYNLWIRFFLLLIFAAAIFSCWQKEDLDKIPGSDKDSAEAEISPSPSYGDTIISLGDSPPDYYIPFLYEEEEYWDIFSMLYNRLYDLSDSDEVLSDPHRILVHLKKDVRWHDQLDFTADDVVFTFRAILDPEVQSPWRKKYSPILRSVEAADPFTVVFICSETAADEIFDCFILPAHLLHGSNPRDTPFNRNPVGTGPFHFTDYTPGEELRLDNFKGYFKGRPFVDSMIIRFIPDESAAFLAMLNGKIDMMYVSVNLLERKISDPLFSSKFNVYLSQRATSFLSIQYNCTDSVLKDFKVRQALTLALDRKRLIDEVEYGYGIEFAGPFHPLSEYSDPDVKPLPFSPQSARRLLADAGWSDSNHDGRLDKDGRQLTIEVVMVNWKERDSWFSDVMRTQKLTIGLIKEMWNEIGVGLSVKPVDINELMTLNNSREFSAVLLWSDLKPDLSGNYSLWHSLQNPGLTREIPNDVFNLTGYSNPEVDSMLEQALSETDPQVVAGLCRRVHRIIHSEQPCSWLFLVPDALVADKRIYGIETIDGEIVVQPERLYVPINMQKYH